MSILKDATGDGFGARVDSRHDLHVNSRTRQRYQVRAGEGKMFVISLPVTALTTSTARVLWFQFLETTLQFHVQRAVFSFNGGTATRNKTLKVSTYIGDSEPTANQVEGVARNALVGDLGSFLYKFYTWDGVGNGMTIVTPGQLAVQTLIGSGLTWLGYEGTVVLGPQQILSWDLIPEEDGLAAMSLWGYLIDPEEED